jgi:undecaprenyl-diphosphatase
MDILKAIILGLIQGLTEFLPVSSSGHIELGKALLQNVEDVGLDFSILVHIATALSTVIVFRKIIFSLFKDLFNGQKDALAYTGKLLLSAVPVAVVGLLFKDEIESLFEGDIVLVGFMLLITALLLFLTIRVKVHDRNINWLDALVIGFAQTIAIMPGISRSGATFATALLLRVDK